jgi:hypothetical protein
MRKRRGRIVFRIRIRNAGKEEEEREERFRIRIRNAGKKGRS